MRWSGTLAALGALCLSHAGSLAADDMSEEELRQLYLDVVETAVSAFEPLWIDDSLNVPGEGFFDFRKYGNWCEPWYAPVIIPPGNGMVAYCYAVLLTETDKQEFSELHVPRAVLRERAVSALRWVCLTSDYVEGAYPYLPDSAPADARKDTYRNGHWYRKTGCRADMLGWITLAAAKLWPELDDDTKRLLADVFRVGSRTERQSGRTWRFDQGGEHDRIKQDNASTLGAAYLLPDYAPCMDLVRADGIDLVATLHDFANPTVVEGKPVSEWARNWNLYPDYSSDHHKWCNLWYGIDLLFEARCYVELLSAITGRPVPDTYTYDGNGFDGVLEWAKVLCLPEGEPGSIHGQEYDAYYGLGTLAFCYGSIVKRDPVAAALERRAARLLREQSRAVGQYDYHRNSWAKAATAYLMHKRVGPGVEPVPQAEAWDALRGTHHYTRQQALLHRSSEKWASFAWGSISGQRSDGLCGFVVPAGPGAEERDPLAYFHAYSLIGRLTLTPPEGGKEITDRREPLYAFRRNDRGFSTGGTVTEPSLRRTYAFFSFDEGPCALFSAFEALKEHRLAWTGLPLYFYVREGVTRDRTLHTAVGARALGESAGSLGESAWWCVDDSLGLAIADGPRPIEVTRQPGYNWARLPEYRDKCDGVFVSPLAETLLHPGDRPVDLAVAIYTDTSHEDMRRMAESLAAEALALPDGWRGMVTPDMRTEGRRFLALANLYGKEAETTLRLTMPEGAPVLDRDTLVIGRAATAPVRLAPNETLGETLELYLTVEPGHTVAARRAARDRYVLRPLDGEPTRVSVRFRGRGPAALELRRDEDGATERLPLHSPRFSRPWTVTLRGPAVLAVSGPAHDDAIAPAVEIAAVETREDGRVTVRVRADDASGVASVELLCDGVSLGSLDREPFIWTCRPSDGPHTYQAVAVDAARNRRESFRETVIVTRGGR